MRSYKKLDIALIVVLVSFALLLLVVGYNMPDKGIMNVLCIAWLELVLIFGVLMTYLFTKQ